MGYSLGWSYGIGVAGAAYSHSGKGSNLTFRYSASFFGFYGSRSYRGGKFIGASYGFGGIFGYKRIFGLEGGFTIGSEKAYFGGSAGPLGYSRTWEGRHSWADNDPILIDLDNDGIELVDPDDNPILFDMNVDGTQQITSWLSGDDGFLVHDLDGDGQIADRSEMLSDVYADGVYSSGIAALATLDDNNDGFFDQDDSSYSELLVWKDTNVDGITNDNELLSLSSLGILSIDLNSSDVQIEDDYGNTITSQTSASLSNGGTHQVYDVAMATFDKPFSFDGEENGFRRYYDEWGYTLGIASASVDGAIIDVANAGFDAVVGSAGNDLISNSGDDRVFARGGLGKDTLIGGSHDDILSGGEGADTLIGGEGNDLLIADALDMQIDGGEGFDTLIVSGELDYSIDMAVKNVEAVYGADGNDTIDASATSEGIIILGGAGNDQLIGSNHDDILGGGIGDDIIDGNSGYDTVNFEGKQSDYEITHNEDGTTTVRHLNAIDGSDEGTDTLSDVERLIFSDGSVHLDGKNNRIQTNDDEYEMRGTAPAIIKIEELLLNDFDIDGDQITLLSVEKAIGGSVELNGDGTITFDPDEGLVGKASFEYTVSDGYSTKSAKVEFDIKQGIPDDPFFQYQWHLDALNLVEVWDDYTGKGVKIIDMEGGISDVAHADLADSIDPFLSYDDGKGVEKHATAVAGLIGADRNGEGVVGVAYNADLGHVSRSGWSTWEDRIRRLTDLGADVGNLIGNYNEAFTFDFNQSPFSGWENALEYAVQTGRGGLGTALTVTGGNQRHDVRTSFTSEYGASSANYNNFINSRYTIGVAATMRDLSVTFSNPGANLLVAAPGVDLLTTDLVGSAGYANDENDDFGADYTWFSGTCGGTPLVSGAIALMLEANPNLGYRDVQEIIAYSSAQVLPNASSWSYNGAVNWNGGGLHVSNDYGFGMINPWAAVRLAETWQQQSTAVNELSVSQSSTPSFFIEDTSTTTDSISITSPIEVEHVEVELNIDHQNLGDLIVSIISPDGTESILMDRAGKDPSLNQDFGLGPTNLQFTLSSTHHWGENAIGEWTLKVQDVKGGYTGVLNNWTLNLYGNAPSENNVYFFTDEFADFSDVSDASRHVISDDGGVDTINAAATRDDLYIDLSSNKAFEIAGSALTLSEGTEIENVFSGDGSDKIIGSDADNWLRGGRGSDFLEGGNGADTLDGGSGYDIANYSNSQAHIEIDLNDDLAESGGEAEGDVLSNIESIIGTKFDDQISGDDNDNDLSGEKGDDTLRGNAGADRIYGADGNDLLEGGTGDDILSGGAGNDTLIGGDGHDIALIRGYSDEYTITRDGNGITLTGAHETEYLVGVEELEFSDLTLEVGEQGWAPIVRGDIISGVEDTVIVITPEELLSNDEDFDGDQLSITSVSNPKFGTVEIDVSGNIIFTPEPNYNGDAYFEYNVSDGIQTRTASVFVDIASVNDGSPILIDGNGAVANNSVLHGKLDASDLDDAVDDLIFELESDVSNGILVLKEDGSYTYKAFPGFTGQDSFTYRVTDLDGASTVAIMNLDVIPGTYSGLDVEESENVIDSSISFAGKSVGNIVEYEIVTLSESTRILTWYDETEIKGCVVTNDNMPVGNAFTLIEGRDITAYEVKATGDEKFTVVYQLKTRVPYDQYYKAHYSLYFKSFDSFGQPVASSQNELSDGTTTGGEVQESYSSDNFEFQGEPIFTTQSLDNNNQFNIDRPDIIVLNNGYNLVTWSALNPDLPMNNGYYSYEILGQYIDDIGNLSGGVFRISDTEVKSGYTPPRVKTSMLTDGDFIVSWVDYENNSIQVKKYNELGISTGVEETLYQGGVIGALAPSCDISGFEDGSFVLSWCSASAPMRPNI